MKRAIAALVAVAALAPRAASANEADAYGLGSRSSGMAGAVAADAVDFSANYYNPAGLTSAPGLMLSIGYVYEANHLRVNDLDNNVAAAHGLVGGLVAPGKIMGIPFAFGIGTYLPDDGLSRIKALRQETPRWALYDERASILFLAANLAVRPLPWLEIGGGLAFLAATQGSFGIRGTADVLHPYDSKLQHAVDADLTAIRYPQLGVRFKIFDLGYVGLAYRGESKLKLGLTAHLEGAIDFAGADIPLVYDLDSHTIDAFLPQQVVLGLSFQKFENVRVNFDLGWVNWGAYESPTAQTKAHLAVDAPPGLPITLPADPKPTNVVPPSFSNQLVPRVAVEWTIPIAGAPRKVAGVEKEHRLLEIPVRAGYAFERSPVPDQTGTTNFIDCDRHTFAIGFGAIVNAPHTILPGSVRVDFHGQASVLPERLTKKDNPADFIGSYRASGSMLGGGATLTVGF